MLAHAREKRERKNKERREERKERIMKLEKWGERERELGVVEGRGGVRLDTGWKTSPALTPTGDPAGERAPAPPGWPTTAMHLLWLLEVACCDEVTVGDGDKGFTGEDWLLGSCPRRR